MNKKNKIILLTLLFSFVVILFSNTTTKSRAAEGDAPSVFYLMVFICRSIIGMLALPILYIKFFLKRPVGDFGFRMPENIKDALLFIGITVFAALPVLILFSANSSFWNLYSYNGLSFYNVIFQMVILTAVYFVAEEFMFRGFLLFSLREAYGYWGILLANIIFTLFHLAKPMPEVALAFFSGLAFSYLAIRSKSYLVAAGAHYAIALILNLIINFYWLAGF